MRSVLHLCRCHVIDSWSGECGRRIKGVGILRVGKMKYFIQFANQENKSFWKDEFKSLHEMFDLESTNLDGNEDMWNSPLVVIDLPSEAVAVQMISRSVLAKSIYELWCEKSSFDSVRQWFAECDKKEVEKYFGDRNKSFKVVVHGINKKFSMKEQLQKIQAMLLPYETLNGVVNLTNPDYEFGLFDEFEYNQAAGRSLKTAGSRCLFGRLVSHSMRSMRHKFKLSDRQFIGNTSMDVTLAFLMANMALIRKDDLVYDPFVGSGSILLACGYFGAYGWGSDIDYNIIHGLGKSSKNDKKWRTEEENLRANYEQYDMPHLFVGTMVADSSRSERLFRCNELFDAIVTDPPYGIRESSRKVAKSAVAASVQEHHIPVKESYDTQDTIMDLINFAASRLRVGGRLVFWLPVVKCDFSVENLPRHSCFRDISSCAQSLGTKIERRLVVMEKIKRLSEGDGSAICDVNHYEKSFRERYFMPH